MLQVMALASGGPRAAQAAEKLPLRRLNGHPLRVLIVEDEGFIVLDLIDIIEGLGGEIAGTAVAADEALVKAGEDRPDVVLMDIRLARGDGIEAAYAIRSRYQTPIVFVTGNMDNETLRRIQMFGSAPVVGKPLVIADLRDAILRAYPR